MKVHNKNCYLIYIFFVITFIALVAQLLPYYSFITKNNENLASFQIVQKQFVDKSLKNKLFSENLFNTIYEKNKFYKPKIWLFGTSTSQYISHQSLNKSFLGFNSIYLSFANSETTKNFIELIHSMYNLNLPQKVLYGLDAFLFNKNLNSYPNAISLNLKEREKFFLDYNLSDYKNLKTILKNNNINYNKSINSNYIGILANHSKEGYDFWGNYYRPNLLIKEEDSSDNKFQKTLRLLKQKKYPFQNFEFSEKKFNNFLQIRDAFLKRGIDFVIFLPPVSPFIYSHTEYDKTMYYNLKKKLELNNVKFYDYSNKDYYNDCSFLDGIHSGDVLTFKIISEIFYLENIISLNQRNENFEIFNKSKYKTTLPSNYITEEKKDILNIGCK